MLGTQRYLDNTKAVISKHASIAAVNMQAQQQQTCKHSSSKYARTAAASMGQVEKTITKKQRESIDVIENVDGKRKSVPQAPKTMNSYEQVKR